MLPPVTLLRLPVHRTAIHKPAPARKPHKIAVRHATGPKTGPYALYDAAQPGATPHGIPQAIYANGAFSRPPSAERGHPATLWIDVNGSKPKANVLDVEPGDASPQTAGPWAAEHARLSGKPAIIYTMKNSWPAVRQSVARHHVKVKFWIADPTNRPHNLKGADATQWGWHKTVDISSTTTNFWRK